MDVKFKKIVFVLFFGICFINFISAIPQIDINIDSNFQDGDDVKFSYRILSQQNETIKYIANVNCIGSPEALLEMEEIDLVVNVPFFEEYIYGKVSENTNIGDCIASISILEPYQISFDKNFTVSGLSNFSFSLILNKKVFIKNENISLNYSSSIENPEISATLIYPDNSTKSIILPTLIKAEQIGTYNLEITASKAGYQDVYLKEQFGVIETEANFQNAEFNTIQGEESEEENFNKIIAPIIIITILIILIVLIIFLMPKIIKKKKVGFQTSTNI